MAESTACPDPRVAARKPDHPVGTLGWLRAITAHLPDDTYIHGVDSLEISTAHDVNGANTAIGFH